MDQVISLKQSLAIPFIIIGLVLFLLISLKLLLFPRQSQPSDQSTACKDVKIVISGAMGNGKTHLWSRLVYGTDKIETVTSMVENKITLNFERHLSSDEKQSKDSVGPSVCLVDTPGHPRLSCRSLARNLPDAKGVIFVINNQVALSGKALRDTTKALELVLSLLQLVHYQRPDSPLPKLSIHLTNSNHSMGKTTTIEKTRANLVKELKRRQLNPSGTSDSGTQFRKTRLESLDAIPSSEFNSFFDIIMRYLKFGRPSNLLDEDNSSAIRLPEEETEVTKLLEEEEDTFTTQFKNLDPLDRYEKLSGHPLHWTVSGATNEDEIDLIKRWIVDL